MFRKLILTTVCGLLACVPQANCGSCRALARANAEEAFSDVAQARKELSNMLVGKTQLTSKELTAAITKAGQCISSCDVELRQDRQQVRQCGIPQTRNQASFLKKVLESIQKVQTGQKLTPEEEDEFEAADSCYRGEIGPLVKAAQRALAARSQQ